MRPKGSVLVHVLVTAVVVSVIAAGLMRMLLLNYAVSQRAAEGVQGRKSAESGLDRIMTAWNTSGGGTVCATIAGSGYSCTGTPGTCNCQCSSPGQATVVASCIVSPTYTSPGCPANQSCRLTITTPP